MSGGLDRFRQACACQRPQDCPFVGLFPVPSLDGCASSVCNFFFCFFFCILERFRPRSWIPQHRKGGAWPVTPVAQLPQLNINRPPFITSSGQNPGQIRAAESTQNKHAQGGGIIPSPKHQKNPVEDDRSAHHPTRIHPGKRNTVAGSEGWQHHCPTSFWPTEKNRM